MRRFFCLIFIFTLAFLLSCKDGETTPASASSVNSNGSDDDEGVGLDSIPPLSSSTPSDPLAQYAWHLHNTGQSTFSSGSGTAGVDLNLETSMAQDYLGAGVKLLVSDCGLESAHEDLTENFLYGEAYDFLNEVAPFLALTAEPDLEASDRCGHGTAVAGIIAAEGWNNKGSRGIAPSAKFSSSNFIDSIQATEMYLTQAGGDFDIFNYSYGYPGYSIFGKSSLTNGYEAKILAGVTNLRGGKGAIYVKSAGNGYMTPLPPESTASTYEYIAVDNSNFDFDNTNPHIIIAGAYNASGVASSYSSMGSNLWISAPAGEFGTNSPAILTADLMGCEYGISNSDDGRNAFDLGNLFNPNCNYTSGMNGTSSAAPAVSGAVALLLSANPNLTYRDIKHIIAVTALPIDASSTNLSNPFSTAPAGYIWDSGWVTNAAGYNFHNRYGFGRVNVDGAIALATNEYIPLGAQVETLDGSGNWLYSSGAISKDIPDHSATGVTDSLQITHDFTVEEVMIEVTTGVHSYISDLAIELTSPLGTRSVLVNCDNSLWPDDINRFNADRFLSNAFYGEGTEGTWTLKMVDCTIGDTGRLTNWKINILGH